MMNFRKIQLHGWRRQSQLDWLRNRSATLLDAVQWQCNTILNEQKPIQNNPSPSIEGLGPLPMKLLENTHVRIT